MSIKSSLGEYSLTFDYKVEALLNKDIDFSYTIVDKRVWELYGETELFKKIKNPLLVEALETDKTVETSLRLIGDLLEMGISRGEAIVGIGGGIVQDIVTFTSSVLFRGVDWSFIPTTLLAQCDSCIGGKSSLNYKTWKNQIGNFYPPKNIYVCSDFLKTLSFQEVRSGVGEMLKVHMIPGDQNYASMRKFMSTIHQDEKTMLEATYSALKVKKTVIEEDEFDKGLRLKMNLGHTFGHALEVASNYKIPHGIAVNIGISIASKFALSFDLINKEREEDLLQYSQLNLEKTDFSELDMTKFYQSLRKDKKNKKGQYCFIVPCGEVGVEIKYFEMSEQTEAIITQSIESVWSHV